MLQIIESPPTDRSRHSRIAGSPTASEPFEIFCRQQKVSGGSFFNMELKAQITAIGFSGFRRFRNLCLFNRSPNSFITCSIAIVFPQTMMRSALFNQAFSDGLFGVPPMIEFRQFAFEKAAGFFFRPLPAFRMLHKKIDQFVDRGIEKFTLDVSPYTGLFPAPIAFSCQPALPVI